MYTFFCVCIKMQMGTRRDWTLGHITLEWRIYIRYCFWIYCFTYESQIWFKICPIEKAIIILKFSLYVIWKQRNVFKNSFFKENYLYFVIFIQTFFKVTTNLDFIVQYTNVTYFCFLNLNKEIIKDKEKDFRIWKEK